MALRPTAAFAALVLGTASVSASWLEDGVVGVAKRLADAGMGQVVRFDTTAETSRLDAITASPTGIPIVMMHGMGDFAENPMGMVQLRNLLAQEANAYVHSVAICSKPDQLSDCDSEDQSNGFFMTMDAQVDQFARVVRADGNLAKGFNAIGFSQGNAIIRGYIERYNDPPVRTFVSMHGVMMGVAGLPRCPMEFPGLGLVCRLVDRLVDLGAYTGYVQRHLAQANYYRDPEDLDSYRKSAQFLPYINNEVKGQENATYKANFASLERLALVMAESDTMIHPKESEHFGYYKDGSQTELMSMKEAPWYVEDWFGLKTLDEAKKIDFYSTPGDHLRFTSDFLIQLAVRYFAPKGDAPVVV